MEKGLNRYIFVYIIFFTFTLSAQGIKTALRISALDSIIAFASNQEVIDNLKFFSTEESVDISQDSIKLLQIKILEKSVSRVLTENINWVDSLNASRSNLDKIFIKEYVGLLAESIYIQYIRKLTEDEPRQAAILYYRAEYLRKAYIASEKEKIFDDYAKTSDLLQEDKIDAAKFMIDKFRDTDKEKLNYLMLKDTMTTSYDKLEINLLSRQRKLLNLMPSIPTKWRFFSGVRFFGNLKSIKVPWTFAYTGTKNVDDKFDYNIQPTGLLRLESQVEYSFCTKYSFNNNYSAGIGLQFSSISNSFVTNYIDGTPAPFKGQLNLEKTILVLMGQYRMDLPWAYPFVSLEIGVCRINRDRITPGPNAQYTSLQSQTSFVPRVAFDFGLEELLNFGRTIAVSTYISLGYNLKHIESIVQKDFILGINIVYILR